MSIYNISVIRSKYMVLKYVSNTFQALIIALFVDNVDTAMSVTHVFTGKHMFISNSLLKQWQIKKIEGVCDVVYDGLYIYH